MKNKYVCDYYISIGVKQKLKLKHFKTECYIECSTSLNETIIRVLWNMWSFDFYLLETENEIETLFNWILE